MTQAIRNEATRNEPLPDQIYDERYFLTGCNGHEEFRSTAGQVLPNRLASCMAAAGLKPGERVLDLGCGRGETTVAAAGTGAQVVGYDYSEAALRIAQELVDRQPAEVRAHIALRRGDAKALPFPDHGFEAVLLLDVVEHLHPWELAACLAEVRRVLAPGGRVVVHTCPNRLFHRWGYPLVWRWVLSAAKRKLQPADLDGEYEQAMHVNEQTPFSLTRALRAAGFLHARTRCQKVWTGPAPHGPAAALQSLVACRPLAWFFQPDLFATGVTFCPRQL